jgi:hypothetical protein
MLQAERTAVLKRLSALHLGRRSMSHSIIRAGIAAVFCLAAVTAGATAQPRMAPKPTKYLPCPVQVQVKFVPVPDPVAGGWTANESPFPVQLDPLNPPKISGGNMVCTYKLLNQPGVFMIYQGVGTHTCVVRWDKKGFNCEY